MYRKILVAAACLLSLCYAQSERGTISGTVLDPTGATVADAKVTLTEQTTNTVRTFLTNSTGNYTAPNLPVGVYTIRVEKDGFRPAVINNLTVNASANVAGDFHLELGAATQAVEVQASAVQLQTEDSRSSTTITNKLVDELPLVVGGTLRSPFDLATLTPEARPIGGDNGFALGGGQGASYGTTLDGVSANTTRALSQSWVATNAPSLEAITEFTVDTNGFKAEYGHSGGGVMTFVSKSGTNSFHGSAYEFLRNDKLDANRFFSNSKGLSKPVYKQNDFGASFGGPVWIPKLYNGRDKTFFFAAYEGFRNRVGATASSFTVPTAEMYGGDFRNWVDNSGRMIPIYDPTTQTVAANGTVTRNPFPNNQIPQNLFNPFAVKALGVFQGSSGVLKPNNGAAPGTAAYVNNNYLVTRGSDVNPYDKFSIKGDHVFGEKDRISGFYGYNRQATTPGAQGPAQLPGIYADYNDTTQASDVFRMSWDHTFNPRLFNHFYAGGNNWRQNHDSPQEYIGNWKDKICLPNAPDCNLNLVRFTWSNSYSNWTGAANNGSENTIYSFNDDLSWIRGKHQFKMGGMYQRSHYNGFGRQCVAGCVGFSFSETGRGGDSNFATAGGNPFASFLLGWADSGSLDTIRFIAQQWPYFAGYFQDDYRVAPRLVLNLGLRWETQLPPVEASDRWSDFSPTRNNPRDGIPGALIYAGTGQGREGSRALADSYFHAFGPHVGFAWNATDKTVIRGSYALSYAAIVTVSGSTHQRGFTQTLNFNNTSQGVQPTFLLDQGLPDWPRPPFIDPSFANKDNIPWWQGREATRPPEMHNFNLSIQRQLTTSTVLELSYNAVMGTHLQSQLLNYDQVNPAYMQQYGPTVLNSLVTSPAAVAAGIQAPYPNFVNEWGSRATVAQALRPFPQYNGIDTYGGGGDHSGHSTYHAGIVKLEKRYAQGLTFTTSYVFSKLLTDSDSYWGQCPPSSSNCVGWSAAADQYNRRLEKSIGQYDITHNFKLGLVYELPFGKGKTWLRSGPASWILGNWRLSSVQLYSSGQPVVLSTTYSMPLFAGRTAPYVTSYEGWRAPTAGGTFDPNADTFFVPYKSGPFPAQGTGTTLNGIGNATRYNPKVRQFPNYNENLSVGKTIPIRENLRLDIRAEAFNIFNRTRFGTGSITLQDQNFGRLTSNADLLNTPRQMQVAMKLYF